MPSYSSCPKYLLRLAACLAMTFLFLVGMPVVFNAHASSGQPQFTLQPTQDASNVAKGGYYVFDAKPRTVQQDRIAVTNVGTATGTAILYAVDATTSPTGGSPIFQTTIPSVM